MILIWSDNTSLSWKNDFQTSYSADMIESLNFTIFPGRFEQRWKSKKSQIHYWLLPRSRLFTYSLFNLNLSRGLNEEVKGSLEDFPWCLSKLSFTWSDDSDESVIDWTNHSYINQTYKKTRIPT